MILNFVDFITEKYLEGSREPLYHLVGNLKGVLESDMLKIKEQVRNVPGKGHSVCFTRSPYFRHDSTHSKQRLVLDTDKLIIDGYKPIPIDEVGVSGGGKKTWANSKEGPYNKWSMPWIRRGRKPFNDVEGISNIDNNAMLEFEFEERIYKEIKNLGKYIISIDLVDGQTNSRNAIEKYLEKYPHIKINSFPKDVKNARQTTDITEQFIKVESPKKHIKVFNELFEPQNLQPVTNVDNFEIEDLGNEISSRDFYDMETVSVRRSLDFEDIKKINLHFGEFKVRSYSGQYSFTKEYGSFGDPRYQYKGLIAKISFPHIEEGEIVDHKYEIYKKYKDIKYVLNLNISIKLGQDKSTKFSQYGFKSLDELLNFVDSLGE